MRKIVKQLTPWQNNPRTISPSALAGIKKSLEEFGDLSGIVFNSQLNALVTGHQRTSTLPPNAKIEIVHKYKKPTRTGTIAEGVILIDGEKIHYREVKWDESKHIAANIAANSQFLMGEFTSEAKLLLDSLTIEGLNFEQLEAELEKIFKDKTPDDFKKLDETLSTNHQCPKCGYVWGESK